MTLFGFTPASGPLSRLHPLVKMTVLLIISSIAMNASPIQLFILVIPSLLMLISAKPVLKQTVQRAIFLLWMTFFIFLMKLICLGFNLQSFFNALVQTSIYMFRLVIIFLQAETFFRTTSPRDLGTSLTHLIRKTLRRKNIDPGLFLALSISYIPKTFEAWKRSSNAALMRGFRFSGIRGFTATMELLSSFISNAIRFAARSAKAMESRGYTKKRTIQDFHISLGDYLLMALAIILKIFTIPSVYSFIINMTGLQTYME